MTDELPLSIENLSFRYRSRKDIALKDVNLSVPRGQLVLIAGASGCGKTTLARCINGLIPRSYKGELNGKILLNGQDASKMSLSRISQSVATVLQDPERQILGTKVLTEVAFGLENLGLPRAEILERAYAAMDFLGIRPLAERETFNLSGGEKQKVALAGVLAMNPSILMLDEPLASLDPASAQDTLSRVRQLADDGMAVLMIEHRVEDVIRYRPDRVLFMQEGEIRYDGPLTGLEGAVDYHDVKLPAPMIMRMARKDPQPHPRQILPGGQVAIQQSGGRPEPLVRFEEVSFGYDNDSTVLKDVTLEINPGDVIAVLGPNGAGKTTLVKHAIGLLKPRQGRVMVEGKDTTEISVAQVAQTLGYVFQSPSHMLFAPTVEEELSFGPINLGHPKDQIQEEVKEAIQIVNLAGMEKNPPLALSFGQQKRVSIAAILAMRSKILVMDEPTAGQDYKNYMNFMDAILQLPNFQAILFITHDVDMAVIYANRVLLVKDGMVVKDGKPEEVLSDENLLHSCRVVPSSLLKTNLEFLPKTGKFQQAETLAHLIPA